MSAIDRSAGACPWRRTVSESDAAPSLPVSSWPSLSRPGPLVSCTMLNMDQYSDASASESGMEQSESQKVKDLPGGDANLDSKSLLMPEPDAEPSPPANPHDPKLCLAAAVGHAPWRKSGPEARFSPPVCAMASAPWRKDAAYANGLKLEGLAVAVPLGAITVHAPWRKGPSPGADARDASPAPDASSTASKAHAPWRNEPSSGADACAASPAPDTSSTASEADLDRMESSSSTDISEVEAEPAVNKETPCENVTLPPRVFNTMDLLRWRAAATDGPGSEAGGKLGYSVVEDSTHKSHEESETQEKDALSRGAGLPGGEAARQDLAVTRRASERKGEEPPPCGGSISGGQACRDSAVMRRASERKVEVSETSWAAQQRARRQQRCKDSDEEVVRTMKSILNKFTLEKFSLLKEQLLNCGIRTTSHVETLIQEIFEKATTQHHFIDMYADLCTLIEEHFACNPIGDTPKVSFRKLLLNACQASFERHLAPPADLERLDYDERVLVQMRYKTHMLGNIRFIGALLARKMLAGKVMIAILEELLADPTPEALESAAALLKETGPTFDRPDWSYAVVFNHFFERVKAIIKKPSCEPRARCLLKDVLDLRASGWQSNRPQRQEKPTTLGGVADQARAELDGGAVPVAKGNILPKIHQLAPRPKPAASECERHAPKDPAETAPTLQPKWPDSDKNAFREEVSKLLAELRYSGDGAEAARRLTEQCPPPAWCQADEFCYLLGRTAEEGSAKVRQDGFAAVAGLVTSGKWCREAAIEGLRIFTEEACEDLRCDVPDLPRILREELSPSMKTLKNAVKVASG